VFFRRCTLPSAAILQLLDGGGHQVGLHLENSRSFDTFHQEIKILENHYGKRVLAVSKHGSGGAKFGFHHYAPYEPEKYVDWAERIPMKVFLGNLEDPTIERTTTEKGLSVFPSAFWLEPSWRDVERFPVDWLTEQAKQKDVVLLVHPENVLADLNLVTQFKMLIRTLESKVFE
jgi:hypothetical protein